LFLGKKSKSGEAIGELMNSWISRWIARLRRIDHRLAAGLMFLFSTGVLGWMVYRQKDQLIHQTWTINAWNILLAFILYAADLLVVAIVWGWILNSLAIHIPLKRHIIFYSVSNIAKRIPGTIWYIAGRGYLYSQGGISVAQVSIASSMEFAVAVLSSLICSLVFAIPQLVSIRAQQWLIAGFVSLSLVILHPKVISWLLNKFKAGENNHYSYLSVLIWIVTYLAAWVLGGVILYFITGALHPIPISDIPYLIGAWSLVGLVSSTFFFFPSNLGVTEVSLSLLLSRIIPGSEAVVIAILMRILLTGFELFWACLSAWFLQKTGFQLNLLVNSKNLTKNHL
jgi:glycosyltransferase 2 family protein